MKKLTMFLAAILFVFAVMPVGNVKAAQVSRTLGNTEEQIVLKDAAISHLGAGTYAGGAVTNLKQTSATSNSVTISWSPASGATGYLVYNMVSQYNYEPLADVKTTSHTLYLPKSTYGYVIAVFPYDANDVGVGDAILVGTVPEKVTGIKYNGVFTKNKNIKGKLNVVWNDNKCVGFEAYCYNKSGKLIQKVDESEYRNVSFSKTNAQNIYTVKVKPYILINKGNDKLYGPVSSTFYAVPQPQITSKNSDVRLNSVKLKWKKVKGASKYVIYCSSKPNSGYKKVATVKGSKSSYTVKRFKGKTLNTRSRKYFKIVTYGKFSKKKTVKSQSKAYLSAITYYRYR